MAEISADLVYELLKKIQSDIAGLRFEMAAAKTEISNLRGTMVSMQMDIHQIYTRLDRVDQRLDRIENRLDLRELAERGQASFDLNA